MKLVKAGALVAIAAFVVAACTSHTSDSDSGSSLRVGAFAGADFAPLWYAQGDRGFAGANVDVAISAGNSGATLTSQLVAGQLDIAGVNLTTAIAAIDKGVPIRIISGSSYLTPEYPSAALAVKADSTASDVADLAGKSVASAVLQTTVDLGIRASLLAKNKSSDAVTVVSIAPPQMSDAVVRGQVAGAVIPEPFLTMVRSNPQLKMLPSPMMALGPNVSSGVLVARSDFVTKHADLVKRFLSVYTGAAKDAQANPAKTRTVIAGYAGISPPVAAELTLPKYDTALDKNSIESQVALLKKLGWISAEVPMEKLTGSPAN